MAKTPRHMDLSTNIAKSKETSRSKQKHGKKHLTHVDLSTNKVFRHILAQEGLVNTIKVIKQVR